MRAGSREGGATYLLLLIGIALTSAGLAATGQLVSAENRSQTLRQLDWVGTQYQNAIGSYYEASPGSVKTYPPSLDALLFDIRYLYVRRHMRLPYADPSTREADWVVIRAPDGGIRGVQSRGAIANGRTFIYQPSSNIVPPHK